jgi:hypothetical protein
LKRFDGAIFWRNFREYAAGFAILLVFAWLILTDTARKLGMLEFVYGGALGVVFVLAYLWWQHRSLTPVDPSADARAYQAAMLARIDKQIRLCGRARYWHLLPFYIPGLWAIKQVSKKDPLFAMIGLAIYTGVYVVVGWLNEVWAVRKLRMERSRIEGLYAE